MDKPKRKPMKPCTKEGSKKMPGCGYKKGGKVKKMKKGGKC